MTSSRPFHSCHLPLTCRNRLRLHKRGGGAGPPPATERPRAHDAHNPSTGRAARCEIRPGRTQPARLRPAHARPSGPAVRLRRPSLRDQMGRGPLPGIYRAAALSPNQPARSTAALPRTGRPLQTVRGHCARCRGRGPRRGQAVATQAAATRLTTCWYPTTSSAAASATSPRSSGTASKGSWLSTQRNRSGRQGDVRLSAN